MKLEVRVKPSSRKNEVLPLGKDCYKVCVKAKPVEGAANEAVCEILAEHFGIAKSRVQVLRGGKSKIKIVEILNGK